MDIGTHKDEKGAIEQAAQLRSIVRNAIRSSKNPLCKIIDSWLDDPDTLTIVTNGDDQDPFNFDVVEGAFPIYKKDTLEDVLKKYGRVYALEITQFLRQWKFEQAVMHHKKGFSKGKQLRVAAKFPKNLKPILDTCQHFGKCPKYFNNKKAMKKLKQLVPHCFVGSM